MVNVTPVISRQCAVCSVQCAVCSVQCAVCSVQCAVCSSVCAVCVQCAWSSTPEVNPGRAHLEDPLAEDLYTDPDPPAVRQLLRLTELRRLRLQFKQLPKVKVSNHELSRKLC